jgi:hypothetical protein
MATRAEAMPRLKLPKKPVFYFKGTVPWLTFRKKIA